MNSECAIAVVLFVILATGNLVIRSVDMPLPVVALPVVIDILFPVALIATLSLSEAPPQPSLTAAQRICTCWRSLAG